MEREKFENAHFPYVTGVARKPFLPTFFHHRPTLPATDHHHRPLILFFLFSLSSLVTFLGSFFFLKLCPSIHPYPSRPLIINPLRRPSDGVGFSSPLYFVLPAFLHPLIGLDSLLDPFCHVFFHSLPLLCVFVAGGFFSISGRGCFFSNFSRGFC